MNVLSLFDGMSCGRIALDRAGLKVNNYYSSEIDKYAIKVSDANYPDIVRLGDVQDWKKWDLPKIDLIIAGSPCQGFSFAGKQLAFDDPRSALFFTFVEILKTIKCYNPKVKFMLENVRMKKEHLTVITDILGVEPVMINSALVSAQNRVRFYWCNWEVSQPQDKGILLKDIISNDENYTLMSDKFINRQKGKNCLVNHFDKKAKNLSAMEYVKNGRQGDYLRCNQVGVASDINGHDALKRIYSTDGKCPTLSTMGGGNQHPKILCGAMRGRYIVDGKRADDKVDSMKGITEQRIEVRHDEKTNCLTTVQKDNLVMLDKTQYRKLTPLECERLQTVPDNYTNHVSNTQRYKMLGNGWTVDVIAHLLKTACN